MARAQLVDERSEEEVSNETVDALDTEDTTESPPEEAAQEEPSVPEKYQNKSLQEVVQMHQEAEKLLGKQSSEVGELRGVVDDYIQTQLAQQQAPAQQQEEDDTDFFVDPQAAVSRAIDNHPKIKQAEQVTQRYRKETALAELKDKHPDMQTILSDSKFAEWIKASKIRTQLFVQADQGYDSEAADELLSLWKERTSVAKQTVKAEQTARKNQVKAASTGNVRGTGQSQRKKVYRRADIIKLMKTDPERYQTISDEILQAYSEGRVK